MIQFIPCSSYEQMSQKCASDMLALVREKPNASIILATGLSPQYAYRLFVQAVLTEKLDVSKVTWIKLDEWAGLPPENPATCDYFIRREILDPLKINPARVIAINQMAEDLAVECERVEQLLAQIPQIDLAVVGVGRNGHVGLNEPADQIPLGVHTVVLDSKTKDHAMLKEAGETAVGSGVTLGMGNILSAAAINVLFTGGEKQSSFAMMQDRVLTMEVPATLLHLHNNVRCYVDETAL